MRAARPIAAQTGRPAYCLSSARRDSSHAARLRQALKSVPGRLQAAGRPVSKLAGPHTANETAATQLSKNMVAALNQATNKPGYARPHEILLSFTLSVKVTTRGDNQGCHSGATTRSDKKQKNRLVNVRLFPDAFGKTVDSSKKLKGSRLRFSSSTDSSFFLNNFLPRGNNG